MTIIYLSSLPFQTTTCVQVCLFWDGIVICPGRIRIEWIWIAVGYFDDNDGNESLLLSSFSSFAIFQSLLCRFIVASSRSLFVDN